MSESPSIPERLRIREEDDHISVQGDAHRVWLTREKMLENAVEELTAERDFLRGVINGLLQERSRV